MVRAIPAPDPLPGRGYHTYARKDAHMAENTPADVEHESALAIPDEAELPLTYQGESWDELVSQSFEFFGGELEVPTSVVGIPFVILRLTFRIGDFLRTDNGELGDYVSVDIMTATEEIIEGRRSRGKIPETSVAGPGEHIVLNLSGTAAYRQLVAFLESSKYIILPEGPDGGNFGTSRLDTPVRQWQIRKDVKVRYDETGAYQSAVFDVRIHCPRGLRGNTADVKAAKDVEFFYLG